MQRQEYASGIDQINCRDAIFDRDILRANHFFCGRWEKCASFDRGVVGDDHYQPRLNPRQAGNYAGCRSAAPFLIHPRRRVDTELKKTSRVGQETNPFAGREPSLTVLAFYSFCAPAFPNLLFLVVHLRHQVRHKTHVGFIAAGRGIYTRGQNRGVRGRGSFDAVSHGRVRKTFGCETTYGITAQQAQANLAQTNLAD